MARYQDTLIIKRTEAGKRYFGPILPSEPKFDQFPQEYIAKAGDRWDQLSYKIYGTPIYWSVLANANDSANGSIFVKQGTILKIPKV